VFPTLIIRFHIGLCLSVSRSISCSGWLHYCLYRPLFSLIWRLP